MIITDEEGCIMALIKCPECGRNISDKANACPSCGCPKDYFSSAAHKEPQIDQQQEFFSCYKCGRNLPVGIDECPFCYYKYKIKHIESNKKINESVKDEQNLITNYLFKKKKHKKGTIYCPACNSINVEFIGSDVVGMHDPVTKTTTKINLNPLKPFTLFDHEDKVVKRGCSGFTVNSWHCRDCGKIFKK